jgi:hypothetical protein
MQMNYFIALRASPAALTAMVEQGTRAIVKVASVNASSNASPHDRLRRRQGRTGQPHRDAVPRIRPVHYPCQRSLPRPLSTPAYASASRPSLRRWPRPPASTLTPRKTIIAGIGGFATRRLTTPEEVATLITYLVSDRTAKITGASYFIDGGLIKASIIRCGRGGGCCLELVHFL